MSGSQRAELAVILGALSAMGALTIDMYLPAMPAMAGDLHARTSLMQLTLTVFVVGMAIGQVVVGPLSDVWGRRRLLLGGLAIYVAGSIACIVAPSVRWLIAARVVQSIGAAAATVLSRAIVRDLFDGAAMTRFFSTLMLVNGVAPVVAPVIGGQLLGVASWRVMFLVLALVGVILLLVVRSRLPESLPEERRQRADLRATLRAYAPLCRDVAYLRHVITASLMFGALFAYISGSTFVFQDIYGLSAEQFSFVFAANGLGIMVFGQVNGWLVGRVADEHTLLGLSLLAATVGGCGALVSISAELPPPMLFACLFVVVSTLGPVLANATSLALAAHASAAGTASSLQGMLQFLIGGAVASAMGAFGEGSAVPMAAAMCLSAAAALAVFASGVRASRATKRPAVERELMGAATR